MLDRELAIRFCQAWKSLSGHLKSCGQPTSVTLFLRFQILYEKELEAEGQAKSELKVREQYTQVLRVCQSILEEKQANKKCKLLFLEMHRNTLFSKILKAATACTV